MSFTVVNGREDHEVRDAVSRGVADGLARLLSVPSHPASVQALLDEQDRAKTDRAERFARPALVSPSKA